MFNLIQTSVPGVLLEKDKRLFVIFSKDTTVIDKIKSALPFVVSRPVFDGYLVALPAHEDTLQVLSNIGLPTSGMEPLRWYYDIPNIEGKFAPMAHQITTAAFLSAHKRAFCTNSMRTGKTASVIMCTDYLQSVKHVQGAVLIVATVSNLTGVWKYTIESTVPHKKVVVVHGGVGKADRLAKLRTPADYYIINYDGVKMVTDELVKMVRTHAIGIVVVDELTHYGNVSSGRFAAMDAVINGRDPVEYAYGLTGSPGDSPIPIFGFVKLINPVRLPCKRVSVWKELTMYRYGLESWMWRNRANCPQIIHRTMQPNIRFDKKDIMDLPPVVRQKRDCELSKEQAVAYERMRTQMITMTENGEVIEAIHKASLSQKLFQIALGTAIASDKSIIELNNRPRINTILEVINESQSKVVIFCPYTGAIDDLYRKLKEHKLTVAVVDGRVTGKKRDNIFKAFQEEADPRVLICHPQTTAFGVELAAADTMIFNGPPLSGEFIYEQALERLSSLKQRAQQVSIVQIAATKEERAFFAGLDAGVKSSALINAMFAEMTRPKNNL